MSMFPIASIIPTVGSSSVKFTNIPQTFTHLQMRYVVRGSDAGGIAFTAMSLNQNEFTSNYSFRIFQGDGSSASTSGGANAGGISSLYSPASTSTSNVFASGIVDLLDYTNTSKNKVTRTLHGFDANGSGQLVFSGGQLLSTGAITSIGLFNMTFTANCRFDLYGISTSTATGA